MPQQEAFSLHHSNSQYHDLEGHLSTPIVPFHFVCLASFRFDPEDLQLSTDVLWFQDDSGGSIMVLANMVFGFVGTTFDQSKRTHAVMGTAYSAASLPVHCAMDTLNLHLLMLLGKSFERRFFSKCCTKRYWLAYNVIFISAVPGKLGDHF